MNNLITTQHDGLYTHQLATYNALNIALYEHRRSKLPWHSDDDKLFDTTSPRHYKSIASFSVGATRQFEFQHKQNNKEGLQEGLTANHARELDKPPTPELCAGPMGKLERLFYPRTNNSKRN
jgi:hypothetical protein